MQRWAAKFRLRFRSLFGKRHVEGELSEELRFHLERQIEENKAKGMSAREARHAAMREFGRFEQVKEECRDARRVRLLETLWQDLRYGARVLRKSPGFSAIAILMLAFGIGANTAIFSVVDNVLLRPLSYPQPDRLYVIHEVIPQWHRFAPTLDANLPDFRLWQQRAHLFSAIAIAESVSADLTGIGQPEEIDGVRSSASLFDVLGVRPALGRGFLPEEDETGHGHVVVLSDAFWRSHFGGDPSIVGKAIALDGSAYQVVGVLPRSFHFLGSSRASFFEPLNGPKPYEEGLIGEFDFLAIGRLAPGTEASQALAELNVIQAQIAKQANQGVDLKATLVPLKDVIVGPARQGLMFLLLATGVVLLIVCVNLASLLLARIPGRLREGAIRAALGATRTRLAAQMLAEALPLALAGGFLGTVLAYAGLDWLSKATPGIPRLAEVAIDARVLGFALGVSLLVAVLFGALPAWRMGRAQPEDALRSGARTASESRRSRHLRQGLVGAEVCLSAALLILAGLLGASLVRILRIDPGFKPENALVVGVDLPPQSYKQPAARIDFYRRVETRIGALPGVAAVGWASMIPLTGQGSVTGISIPNLPQDTASMPMANYRAMSAGYFGAMGIPVIEGRIFNESDRGRNVVVVSRSVAQRFWPGQNPIGKVCDTYWGPRQLDEVIGVVSDVPATELTAAPTMMVYVPDWYGGANLGELGQSGVLREGWLVVRTSKNITGTAASVREVIQGIGPDVPIVALHPADELISASVGTRRFELWLAAAFGFFALLTASLGIAGVVAYSVEQRRHELGIRLALGARPGELRRMVLGQGMAPVVAGLAAGILLAGFVAQLVSTLFYGVRSFEPLPILAVAATVLLVTLGAVMVPARRAMRVDPMRALRHE